MAFNHGTLERHSLLLIVGILLMVSVGGLVQLVPLFYLDSTIEEVKGMRPYSPLELAGRDIYQREGCMMCHSQMVRPFRDETLRYGPWSHAEEYRYDRPFLLGSRRTGPDLHRVGGKYNNQWHYDHMMDPRQIRPQSIMPKYQWLADWEVDPADIAASMRALKRLGTPYTDEQIANVDALLLEEQTVIVDDLRRTGTEVAPNKEIVAVIAYLQRLGSNADQLDRGAE